jgi:hypothetical protein
LNRDIDGWLRSFQPDNVRSHVGGATAFSISLWWQEWRARAIQKRQERQAQTERRIEADKRPTTYAKTLVEGLTAVGRFLAAANGVGLAVSLTLMFSTYISLTSVDNEHICVASQFVSGVVQQGWLAAGDFLFSGILALVAVGWSKCMWVWHNMILHDSVSDLPAPSFESWISSYSERELLNLALWFQVIPLLFSIICFFWGIGHGWLRASPGVIQHNWQVYKAACGTEVAHAPPAAHSP